MQSSIRLMFFLMVLSPWTQLAQAYPFCNSVTAARVREGIFSASGAHGSDLGRLDLTIENGKITGYEQKLILLDHNVVQADATASRLVEELLQPHRKALDEKVGMTVTISRHFFKAS